MGRSAAVLMYFKHSVLTRALSQKSIYSAFFLTTEDVFFVIHADDSAENAVERFEDGDDNFGVNVSIDDGVDTQACDAASGVTTSGTTGNFATTVLRGK